MADILAENLSGKAVMGSDGVELGMLYNITMDLRSGSLTDLVIEPNEELSPAQSGLTTNEDGQLLVPVSAVKAVKDYIVVDR